MSVTFAATEAPAEQAPPAGIDPGWEQWLAQLFGWHTLTVRQKLLTIAQRYIVCDEYDRPLFHVVRPPRLFLNILLRICLGIVQVIALVIAFRLIRAGQVTEAIMILVGSGFLVQFLAVLLAPYRDIRVFADEAEQYPVLSISQDNKVGLFLRYTIHDALGQPVAMARRNVLLGLIRRNWTAMTLDHRVIVQAREDSLILGFLRRYLGPLYGLLRTNFDIILPNGARIGEYNRKLTLTDQYVLVLSDPDFLVDRRVALALAILLDSAEAR